MQIDNQEKENPFVSIGFMTRNRGEHLLGEALDSLLAQTYKNFELIISDDASTDDTPRICEAYAKKDGRIKYFRQEKKLGNPGCYNFVLGKAAGEYFLWACDDDIWDATFLEKCLAVFKKDPGVIMAISDFVETDEHRNSIYKARPADFFPFPKDLYGRLKAFTLFYKENGPQLLVYGLWKREKIADMPFGTYWWGFTDHFVFCALARGPFGFVNEPLWLRITGARLFPLKKRSWMTRITVSFIERTKKIVGTPMFWRNMKCVLDTSGLSAFQKFKLILWNFFVMARLFFVRKV